MTTCRTRSAGLLMVVPGPGFCGSSSPGTKRAPGPVVRLMSTSLPLPRMRSTTLLGLAPAAAIQVALGGLLIW
jgi:hypothetical protein